MICWFTSGKVKMFSEITALEEFKTLRKMKKRKCWPENKHIGWRMLLGRWHFFLKWSLIRWHSFIFRGWSGWHQFIRLIPPCPDYFRAGVTPATTLLSSMLLRTYYHQCCGMWRKHGFVSNFHWLQMDVPKSKGSLRKHLTTWIITASVEGPHTNPICFTDIPGSLHLKIYFQEDPIFVMHFFPADKNYTPVI